MTSNSPLQDKDPYQGGAAAVSAEPTTDREGNVQMTDGDDLTSTTSKLRLISAE